MSKKTQPKPRPSLICRGLTADETEMLGRARDVKPGEPIVLFVCQEGFANFPVDTVFNVAIPMPSDWNHQALASIIDKVLRAANEHDNAHLGALDPWYEEVWKPYCKLHFGRHIEREGRRTITVDRDVPFLKFRTPKAWYTVALPVFPARAVAEMMMDEAISTEVSFQFLLTPTVIERNSFGPRPRVIRQKKSRDQR